MPPCWRLLECRLTRLHVNGLLWRRRGRTWRQKKTGKRELPLYHGLGHFPIQNIEPAVCKAVVSVRWDSNFRVCIDSIMPKRPREHTSSHDTEVTPDELASNEQHWLRDARSFHARAHFGQMGFLLLAIKSISTKSVLKWSRGSYRHVFTLVFNKS